MKKAFFVLTLSTAMLMRNFVFAMDEPRPPRILPTSVDQDRKAVYAMYPWYSTHHRETINVLSIDGGGVRGIIPATFLEKLEEDLDRPICEIFDLVVGTSVGSILALGLTTPYEDDKIRTAAEMVQTCRQLSGEIFPPPILGGIISDTIDLFSKSRYPATPLENNLKTYFGDKKLSDVLIPTVVTSVNARFNTLKLFRNYRASWKSKEDFFVRDVAHASSAAPTYFPIKNMPSVAGELPGSMVDGGMGANNPSLIALSEAQRLFGFTRPINLISLGTGHESIMIDPVDKMCILRAMPTIDMLFSAQSDAVHQILFDLAEDSSRGLKYHRVRVPLANNLMPMDLSANVDDLLRVSRNYLDGEGIEKYKFIRDSLADALNERAPPRRAPLNVPQREEDR